MTPSASRRSPAAHELRPGVWLDARRAVWLAREQTLGVADLHLGYAWAHRHAGQLLPLSAPETAVDRLLELVEEYQPREVAILGDIVHEAVPVAALDDEIRRLCADLVGRLKLRLLAGNHDRALAPLLKRCGLEVELLPWAEYGPHLLLHGDAAGCEAAAKPMESVRAHGGCAVIGHEHPAIRIGDGVASVKCPCFLVAPDLVVLPAFSDWAAGANVRTGEFLSPLAQEARFGVAYAILANKLLAVRI